MPALIKTTVYRKYRTQRDIGLFAGHLRHDRGGQCQRAHADGPCVGGIDGQIIHTEDIAYLHPLRLGKGITQWQGKPRHLPLPCRNDLPPASVDGIWSRGSGPQFDGVLLEGRYGITDVPALQCLE